MSGGASNRLGLVLSGGGAKGAYEAGVVRALADLKVEPAMIAGASIGALNGAIVASAPAMSEAADLLHFLWSNIRKENLAKLRISPARQLTLSVLRILIQGMTSNPFPGSTLLKIEEMSRLEAFSKADSKLLALLDRSPIQAVLENSIDFDYLLSPRSLDLWISVYPACDLRNGALLEILESVVDLGRYLCSSGESKFLRLQDHGRDEAIAILLASAAVPLAYAPLDLRDGCYRDGGMGRRITAQGNTPAAPLIRAGCTHLIVVELDRTQLWDRAEFPEATVIEIRPSEDLGGLSATADFSPATIEKLIEMGEADTHRAIGQLGDCFDAVAEMRADGEEMVQALANLNETDVEVDRAVKRLRERK